MEGEKIFTDVASGAKSARERLGTALALLAFMRPGDALVVWKLDRLGRSLKHLIDVLLQAMAAGRAVVATDVGDVKAMLAPDNRDFVAPKDDGEGFARHLARLLEDPALRAELGARNRDHARAHYGLAPMLQAYERLFEEVAGRK